MKIRLVLILMGLFCLPLSGYTQQNCLQLGGHYKLVRCTDGYDPEVGVGFRLPDYWIGYPGSPWARFGHLRGEYYYGQISTELDIQQKGCEEATFIVPEKKFFSPFTLKLNDAEHVSLKSDRLIYTDIEDVDNNIGSSKAHWNISFELILGNDGSLTYVEKTKVKERVFGFIPYWDTIKARCEFIRE